MKLKHVMYFLLILAGVVAAAAGIILVCERVFKKPILKKEYISCDGEDCLVEE